VRPIVDLVKAAPETDFSFPFSDATAAGKDQHLRTLRECWAGTSGSSVTVPFYAFFADLQASFRPRPYVRRADVPGPRPTQAATSAEEKQPRRSDAAKRQGEDSPRARRIVAMSRMRTWGEERKIVVATRTRTCGRERRVFVAVSTIHGKGGGGEPA
jgi:hypothetical protein